MKLSTEGLNAANVLNNYNY